LILYLDTETFCETPIKHGTHRYAEGVEVLLTAFAIDDAPVEVVEGWTPELTTLAGTADEIVLHNSHFDRTVLAHQGIVIPPARIRDTMAQARSVGLPGGLGKLCDILGVDVDKAKDKAGRALIQLFCKPLAANRKERRATKTTHPVEWQRFVDYAALDVAAMREVAKKLPAWNYGRAAGAPRAGRASWELDQQINDRGFAIDVDFATAAIEAVNQEQRRLAARMAEMTDGEVEAATQRDKLLAHLLAEHGVTLPDMQKGTLERRLHDEQLPATVRELIAIRLEASGTSTAKYQALINGVSSDGRLRGTLEWCGAARTGRWSGRLFQPQNLPRPRHKPAEIVASIEAVRAGCADLLYDDVIARCSSAIRGAIVAPVGRKLVVADLSNIEGRVLAWLAGELWKTAAFASFDRGEGADLYRLAYGRAFGIAPHEVTDDQRHLGKVMELALGYQGAVGAFLSMARLYGADLPEAEVLKLVKAWRKANAEIVDFWYSMERVAHQAVRNSGVTLTLGRLRLRRDGAWLRIVLPSGRALCYPSPRLDDGENGGRAVLTYMGVNQYTRAWERLSTYGGKLVENVTQAVARDVIADAMPRAEAAGFAVVLTVHDEIVSETQDHPAWTARGLAKIMSTNPTWADGLPLAAAGFEGKRYGKG
jgi:DNA polymerase